MKKGYRILLMILPLLVSLGAKAGEIKGVVKDSKTNEPLGLAMVIATSPEKPEGVNAQTNENGEYSFTNLPAGTYSVVANYAGAISKAPVTVTLTASGTEVVSLSVSESDAKGTTVTITASRIPRPNVDASIPVTTLTAAELMTTGEVSMGDKVGLLPSFTPFFSTQNSGRFIGTAGLSILNLRGQGTARTLVLQNGRRHVTSDPGESGVDVNTIPNDLLERVDVVTGGNSAVYGSDAVAGVVNFITKRDYEGLGVRLQSGISSRYDRPTFRGSVTGGTNFDNKKGNIAGNLEFTQSDPLYFTQRDEFTGAISGRSRFLLTDDRSFPTAEPNGTDGVPDRSFLRGTRNILTSTGGAFTSLCPAAAPGNLALRNLNCSGVFNSAGTTQFGKVFVFAPDGSLVENVVQQDLRPFGNNNAVGGLGATLLETGLLQTGTNTIGLNLLGSYKLIDAFRPFLEAKYVRSHSIQQGQPTFIPSSINPVFQLSNPFLTDQARALLTTSLAPGVTTFEISRFNTDFAGRGENHSRDLYRFVVGADGRFLDTWRYEAAFNYGRVNTFYTTKGNINLAKFNNAVNAVRNTAGQIVCAINADSNPANDDPTCVPLNLFGMGAPSSGALEYIKHDSTRVQNADQMDVSGYVSGDLGMLFSLPGGPIAFSLGGEWRRETSFSSFDEFTRASPARTFLNSIPNFEPPALNIYEGFAELRIPILADMPFAKELTVEGAGRVSNYSTGSTGTVWTGNIGAIYSPIEDIRMRGSYAVAVRAPTQGDLFFPPSQNFALINDPCGQQNITANPNRVANCAAAGVPTTQTFNSTTEPFRNIMPSSISGLVGGNPDLTAEKSNSYTIGGVIQPSFAPGLVLSVDYFNIDLTNAINTLGAQTIINQCYDSPDGIDNQFCRAITRNPNGTFAGQGSVSHGGTTVSFPMTGSSFLQGPFNYARQNTSGIDFDLSYAKKFGDDWRVNGRGIVSYLINRDNYTSTTEPGRLSQLKHNLGNPEWNGQLRLNAGFKDFDFSWNLRYIGEMTVAAFSAQNSEQGRPPTDLDAFPIVWYPSATYNDVRASLKVCALQAKFFVGIDNIFDVLPPLGLLGNGEGDAIFTNTGRFLYMGVDFNY